MKEIERDRERKRESECMFVCVCPCDMLGALLVPVVSEAPCVCV